MIHLRILTLLLLVPFINSCSTDDSQGYDPIFTAEYTPLKDMSEIGKSTYFYAGIKIEGRNVGLLPNNAEICLKDDKLTPIFDNEGNFIRLEFQRSNKHCSGGFTEIYMIQNYLVQPGYMYTNLYLVGGYIINPITGGKEETPTLESKSYKGELEIGFQAGYLRIEDQLSHYTRPKATDKVYLYFRKSDK